MLPRRAALCLLLTLVGLPVAAQTSESRVEREASNPMRRIIEASKIKPKPRTETPAVALPARPASAPVREARPAVEAASAAEVPIETLPPQPLRSAVATVDVAAELVTLRVLEQDEPSIPPELRALVDGEVAVDVGFTVLPDGRVAEALVRRSSHPELDAAVLEAVRQWRYRPIPVSTPHEVALVLRAGRWLFTP